MVKKATIAAIVRSSERIIEIGARDEAFASLVDERETSAYLPLFDQAFTRTADAEEQCNAFLFVYRDATQISKNNADLLVLAPRHARHLWTFAHFSHARHLTWTPGLDVDTVLAWLGLFKNVLLKRLKVVGYETIKLGNSKRIFCTLKILKRSPLTARRYLSPTSGVEKFFLSLKQRNVEYAVLRWFEDLPHLEPGEDLDILVADDDVSKIEELLQQPGTIPCDLYSVSGLPGTEYRNMAYYPPRLAEEILCNTVWHKQIYRVPDRRRHFLSLAYHALYHKGEKAGLTTNLSVVVSKDPEHDYAGHLAQLAGGTFEETPLSMESLEAELAREGWRAPLDTAARLALQNAWLKERLKQHSAKQTAAYTGLTVFFIRQRAVDLNVVKELEELLAKEGFHVIVSNPLAPEARARVRTSVRGGNWGSGPYPTSGGDPAHIIAAIDLVPAAPRESDKERFPTLDNAHILAKEYVRDWFNAQVEAGAHCNIIHSSDNRHEALHYLRLGLPDEASHILEAAERLRESFVTREPVLFDLTNHGRRAKAEVINYNGELAVKKTFRPGYERFMVRERFALESLSKLRPEIPPLLEAGPSHLIYPFYQDSLHLNRGMFRLPLSLPIARQTIEVLRFFYEQGYAHGDFTPSNILWNRHQGLKIIDFEFLYKYEQKPATFTASYDLVGLPPDFPGDKPKDVNPSYDALWKPLIGLTVNDLLYAPAHRQHLLRARHFLFRLPKQGTGQLRRLCFNVLRWSVRRLNPTPVGRLLRWLVS